MVPGMMIQTNSIDLRVLSRKRWNALPRVPVAVVVVAKVKGHRALATVVAERVLEVVLEAAREVAKQGTKPTAGKRKAMRRKKKMSEPTSPSIQASVYIEIDAVR